MTTPKKLAPRRVKTYTEADLVETEQVMITPDMAIEFLNANGANRPVKQARVDTLARDMANGRWSMTGESIKFSKRGRLLDGQHRLWAIIQSEMTIPMLIVRGLEEDAQLNMDARGARTPSDHLAMQGEINATALAAASRLGVIVERGALWGERKSLWHVSNTELFDFIDKHPEIRDSVSFVYKTAARKVLTTQSIKAYSHYRFAEIDSEQADDFFIKLGNMSDLKAGSALQALASRLYQLSANRRRAATGEMLSMLFRAWNLTRSETPISKMPLWSPRMKKELPDLV